ncbi:MAG: hypothetical protein M3O09_10275 [Acidobacteriota bacterium]|nr:hypothetical protein [Acidobacteriota bacterium]
MPTPSYTYPKDSLLAFEIALQPELWPTTLERVRTAGLPPVLTKSQVILTGAGTSAYAASAIAEAWPLAKAIPTTDLLLRSAIEIETAMPSLREGGLLISLARSGASPESTAVVEKFQKVFSRVQHIAIVCNENGRLAHLPGMQVIALDQRTNDRSLAMTGSFSNLVLAGLSLRRHPQFAEHLQNICRRVERGLQESNGLIEEIAHNCKDRIVVLTSSMHALAQEIVLKIIELTDGRVLAMHETFLGFRHGALGFLREDTPIVCFMSSDPHKRLYEEDLMEDLRAKKLGRLVVIGDEPSAARGGEWSIPAIAPFLPDALRTPFEVPLAQLLAYHLSVSVGVDPDNPSPNGTITRVVKAFRIHEELAPA